MCGRFYVDDEMLDEIERICRRIDKNYHHAGDVVPGNTALVIRNAGNNLMAEGCRWGFTKEDSKSLLINARAETITQKVTFSGNFENHRCVVPARGFYEWNQQKQQFRFYRETKPVIYLAGIYKKMEKLDQFAILTHQACGKISDIHDRMPLMIEETDVQAWIYDRNFAIHEIQKEGKSSLCIEAMNKQKYEQLTFFNT